MDAIEFETPEGRRVPAVTAEEMREVDRVATQEVGFGLLGMMENAGRNLSGIAGRMVEEGSVTVLAGSGGNGGGGLCAARHLLNHGRRARVVLDRPPAELSGAAAEQFGILSAMGVTPADDARGAIASAAVVVDALIGYGLRDAPRGRAAELIEACGAADRVLSLDVPSGVDATTGEAPGASVAPERTLTLALPKTGLAGVEGEVYVGDIAIPPVVYERVGIGYDSPFEDDYWLPVEPV